MTINNPDFIKALAFCLQWEGGYSDHPNDSGGETNRGITQATYDNFRLSIGKNKRSVRFLEENELLGIYKQRYWDKSGCDLLPSKLAMAHFDWAVNTGVIRAIKTLQIVVATSADGIIGIKTKAAISDALNRRGEQALVINYNNIRESRYREWGVGNQRVFLQGWLNRLNALRKEVG